MNTTKTLKNGFTYEVSKKYYNELLEEMTPKQKKDLANVIWITESECGDMLLEEKIRCALVCLRVVTANQFLEDMGIVK